VFLIAKPGSILRDALLPALIFTFAGLIYANTLQNGFVMDDTALIPGNPLVQSLGNIPTLFLSDYWQPEMVAGLYRPLVTTSYAVNFWFAGPDPASYHAVNIILHALVAVLVLLLFRILTGDVLVAAAGAFLFAALAVHTEAVAGVVGRAELMAAVFLISSLLCHIKAERSGRPRSRRLYLAGLAAYLLALLCKEIAITLFGLVLLFDLVYSDEADLSQTLRRMGGRLRRTYSGYLGVALAYLIVRHLVIASGPPIDPTSGFDNPLVPLDSGLRGLNALQVTYRYLWLLVFPLHLSYDYSYAQIPLLQSFSELGSVAVLGLGLLGVLVVLWSYRISRHLFFGLGFAIVTFSVVSNVIVPIGTIMGERLLYTPSIGLCLAAAVGLRHLSRVPWIAPGTGRTIFITVFAVIVGLNGWRTVLRNLDWRSEEVLFLSDLETSPGSARVWGNAAGALLNLGRYEEAIAHAKKAIEIRPRFPWAYRSWGHALVQLGRDEEAIEKYEGAIEYARGDPRVVSGALNNLGFMLVDRGIDVARGVRLLERAVATHPDNPHFLDSLGWAYYKAGRLKEAHELVQRSLQIDDSGASGDARRGHLQEIEQALRRVSRPSD
jgi:hypothetical protein